MNYNNDILIYRGTTEKTLSNKFGKAYAGLFFGIMPSNVMGWGEVEEYRILPNAKIYDSNISSEEYAIENDLYDKEYPEFKKYFGMYGNITKISQFPNLSDKERDIINKNVEDCAGKQFCWYDYWTWLAQLAAKLDLEEKGYDGARWQDEDFGNREQYQIWNLDVIEQTDESDFSFDDDYEWDYYLNLNDEDFSESLKEKNTLIKEGVSMATKSIEAELSFVVRNLETGEDSRWIELHRMDEDMVRQIWNSVVDTRFDWEIVDLESNFSLDYYEFQYASLEALMEAFEVLENASRFDDEALALEAALEDGNSLFEAANRTQDATVIMVDDETDAELGIRYVEMLGGVDTVGRTGDFFDYESFGRDLGFSGFVSDMEQDSPEMAEELMGMFDYELGEWYVENFYGDVSELPKEELERYFDYDQLGRELQYDFIYVELEGLSAQVRFD